jgi:hypothetical protein
MMSDRRGSAGICVADVNNVNDARQILTRNRVNVGRGTNTRQMIAVAKGIQQIEILAGASASKYITGTNFTFPKRRHNSSYRGGGVIAMGSNHRDGNVSHVMHELGHHVGMAGLYGPYKKQVGTCHHTGYCKMRWRGQAPRNEEFAEVFSAFVTHPELLKNSKMKGCRQAYEFLSKHFKQAGRYAVCNKSLLNTAASSLLKEINVRRTRVAEVRTERAQRSTAGYQ